MSSPKRIQPGDTIGLKLGVSERLSIQKLTMVDSEIAERVAKAPKSQPRIPFTLDELDDLIGHVAADLNHTKDENRQYWLEKLYNKIDYVLQRYTDEPEISKEKHGLVDVAEAINLADWATLMLEMAHRSNVPTNQYNCKVILSKAQRRTILELGISDEMRELLTVDAAGPRTFNFTGDELASICLTLAEPLATAKGKYRNHLLKAAEKVAQGLTDSLTSQKRRTRKTKKPTTAFQLKVTLRDVKPVVWRQFQVVDCKLPELHSVIQTVMGWQNCHLYYFEAGNTTYSDPSLCQDMESADGRRIRLSHLVKQGYERFDYVYDYGDFWEHTVEVESVFQPEDDARFPICLEGAASSPPEDVGGSMGYEEFLRIINDPEDTEHEHYLDWCGGWFDPDAFDVELVNRMLVRLA